MTDDTTATEGTTPPKKEKQIICSICRRPIPEFHGWKGGNNAQPINNGRCCYVCNDTIVIPARLRRLGHGG